MRTIGKHNITKLKAIVAEEMDKGRREYVSQPTISDRIEARIPAAWYDIWESAHDEIARITDDEVMRIIHSR